MIVAELFARLGLIPDKGSFDKGHELIDGLHHALEAYLGYEGIKKVGELVEGTVHAAVETKHLGERLGITSDAVQELGYAADVSGASAEDMTVAMQRLALGMELVKKTGSGPLADGLRALRIPFRALKGETLDQNLEAIAEGFKKAGPQVNKTGIAMELFGRSGAKLIPLLNEGKDGIVELRNEAEKMGVVIDEEGIQKAEEFEISQKKLGATLKGVRNDAVLAMLPALQEMLNGLQAWISANREAISSTLAAVLKGIAFAFSVIGDVVSGVIDVVQFLGDHLDILAAAIAGVAAVLLPLIAEWVAGMAIAAAETVLAAAPFIAIGAAVALITLGIIKLIKHWQGFMEAVADIGDRITDAFKAVANGIQDAFEAAFNFIADLPVVKRILEALQDAHDAWGSVKNKRDQVVNDAVENKFDAAALAGGGIDTVGYAADIPKGFEGSTQNTTIGDTNITITNAQNLDENLLVSKIKDEVREAHLDAVRQAHENISGGKR